MGSLQSKIPEGADHAVKFLQYYDIDEISMIFEQLSKTSSQKNVEVSKGIDKNVFGEYFAYPGLLRDQIFIIFDENQDGYIDRDEFMRGVAICCKGALEDKLNFCFNMFDLSRDGYIDRNELRRCLQSTAFASFALLHAVARELPRLEGHKDEITTFDSQNESIDADVHLSSFEGSRNNSFKDWFFSSSDNPARLEEEIENMVEDAFSTCDLNCDGKLSLEEFRIWMFCTPEVVRILYGVFEKRKHVDLEEVEKEFQGIEEKLDSNLSIDEVVANLTIFEREIPNLIKRNIDLSKQVELLLKDQKKLFEKIETIHPGTVVCVSPKKVVQHRKSWIAMNEEQLKLGNQRRSFYDIEGLSLSQPKILPLSEEKNSDTMKKIRSKFSWKSPTDSSREVLLSTSEEK